MHAPHKHIKYQTPVWPPQVISCPMSFFDTTPTGRILNRFSKDQEEVDTVLPFHINVFLLFSLLVAFTIIIISAVFPYMVIAVVIIGALIIFVLLWVDYTVTSSHNRADLHRDCATIYMNMMLSAVMSLQPVPQGCLSDEEDGEYKLLSLYLPHHLHPAGPQYHPCLQFKG